jgi:HD-GYP domain-containing protein (c-di-GMP phosphodiesterase class II)
LEKKEKRLYNSRIVDTYIKLIKRSYSYININELLVYSGIEIYQIEDEGHWFTQNQINRFHKRLRVLTGNKNIAYEAGRYAASPEALGVMRRYLLGMVSMPKVYELISRTVSSFTKSSNYSSQSISNNEVEIVVTLNEGVTEEKFQCQSRLGYIEALSNMLKHKISKVEHPECLFKGGNVCRYKISWEESRADKWRSIRNVTTVSSLFAWLILTFIFSITTSVATFLLFLAVYLVLYSHAKHLDVIELQRAVDNLSWSSQELVDQININYENSLLINEIGQALNKENDLDGVLSAVVHVLENRLDYDRGLVLFANKERTRLVSKAGYGYDLKNLSKFMMSSGFHLDKKDSKGVFINCFRRQEPFLINNFDEISDNLSKRSLQFAQKMGVKSFICCPIVYEGESLGVLAVDNIKTKRPLVQSNLNILMGIVPQIATSIHNIKLVEARLKQFQSILQTLVASTEARDPITAGHSQKVTEYAVGICQELGLPADYTDMIRVASSLHDYGKIGVDDAILKKTGRLNDEEYEHIKTHVDKTRSILEQVRFEGVFKEVPRIASSHHEKLDGTGYPLGLTEEEIPFGGKIIAVADVFEALTSRRHYRDPMPINEALDKMISNVGNHFDKSCLEAFIRYYNNEAPINYIPKGNFISLKNVA